MREGTLRTNYYAMFSVCLSPFFVALERQSLSELTRDLICGHHTARANYYSTQVRGGKAAHFQIVSHIAEVCGLVVWASPGVVDQEDRSLNFARLENKMSVSSLLQSAKSHFLKRGVL